MEFDFYRNFLVLAESNTMSSAARKLNIVQTALSSQITKLRRMSHSVWEQEPDNSLGTEEA